MLFPGPIKRPDIDHRLWNDRMKFVALLYVSISRAPSFLIPIEVYKFYKNRSLQ